MKRILSLLLPLTSYLLPLQAQTADEKPATVYIRDVAANVHGNIHYWCNASNSFLGWTTEGMGSTDCQFCLVPDGQDNDGNELYYVQHEESGLYVKGLNFLTTPQNPDDSDQRSPLVGSKSEAHALTFEQLPDGNYLISDRVDDGNGYHGGDGYYNYAMCGNHGNVGGYYRDFDFGDGTGLYTFACEWEVVPALNGDDLGQADIPSGEEVYVCLIPNWSNHGEYIWTSDGTCVSLIRLNKEQPTANDFAAAAFIKVPTDVPDRYKLFHIQSQRYLYGLNYIADSKSADPTDIYDGDPWDNQCITTDDADKAHALIINHDYSWTTYSGLRTYNFAERGWWVIKDPVVENNHDGCHYYGGEYGYCVYMTYSNTGYERGGIGSVFCSSPGGYMADPWAIRTPQELADYLGLAEIPSQLPTGVTSLPAASTAPKPAGVYDLQGRPAAASHHGISIEASRKVMR